jgi:hypothetical protein
MPFDIAACYLSSSTAADAPGKTAIFPTFGVVIGTLQQKGLWVSYPKQTRRGRTLLSLATEKMGFRDA